MNPILKNILAIVAGAVVGIIVNSGIILMSSSLIEFPEGVDPSSVESLKENIHLFQPKHFIFPFLAHALGTLIGSFVAAKFAATHSLKLALGIGVFFLLGGIVNVMMLNGPLWFTLLDLIIAYIPMAFIGAKLSRR